MPNLALMCDFLQAPMTASTRRAAARTRAGDGSGLIGASLTAQTPRGSTRAHRTFLLVMTWCRVRKTQTGQHLAAGQQLDA